MALSRITSGSIFDGSVVAAEIANNSITEAKIQDGAVSAAKLGTIYTANISDVGTIATQDSDNVTITGGTVSGTLSGDFTGNATVTSQKETKVDMATDAIDLSLGNYFTKNCTATVTFTVSNTPSANTVGAFVLDLTNGGDQTINWFSNVVWNGGTAPTLTSGGRDCLAFFTHDAGTTWNGFVLGQAMAAAA